MKNKKKEKRATVLGLYEDRGLFKAIELLRKAGYRVSSTPVSGIELEIRCYQPDKEAILIKDLKTLEKFLNGEEIPRSMWTLI